MTISLADQVLPKAVKDGVMRTIDPHLKMRANGSGVCSTKTRHERQSFYLLMVAQLWQLGFRIRKLESLAGKHVEALMEMWFKNDIAASNLHTRLSMVRVLCHDWLGKEGLVKNIADYLPADQVRRNTVAKDSKAWDDKGVDPWEIIGLAKQIDERLAVMLAMQHAFGLRVKESIELRPANAVVEGGRAIQVYEGTKGGLLRRIDIVCDTQRQTLEWARRVAGKGKTGRLRWTDLSWKQAQNRFYNLARKRLGLTRKDLGVTCHGLRHGFAHWRYEFHTGLPTPVQGGALGKIDRATHQGACMDVTRELGHNRKDVTTGYYGSYGHSLRQTGPVKMSYSLSLPA